VPFYNAKGRLLLSVLQPIDYLKVTKPKRSDFLYLRTIYRSFSVSIFHKPLYMLFPLKRKSFEARNINFIQKRTLPHQATKFAIEGTERP
jgi:hypothetical protein